MTGIQYLQHNRLFDRQHPDQLKQELIEQGGKRTVPCLRIEHSADNIEWLYESSDIVKYLQKNIAA